MSNCTRLISRFLKQIFAHNLQTVNKIQFRVKDLETIVKSGEILVKTKSTCWSSDKIAVFHFLILRVLLPHTNCKTCTEGAVAQRLLEHTLLHQKSSNKLGVRSKQLLRALFFAAHKKVKITP
jgi:hypothetical protein